MKKLFLVVVILAGAYYKFMVPPTISSEECEQYDGTISPTTGECNAVTKTECDFYGGEITSENVCTRDGELVLMKGTVKWDE